MQYSVYSHSHRGDAAVSAVVVVVVVVVSAGRHSHHNLSLLLILIHAVSYCLVLGSRMVAWNGQAIAKRPQRTLKLEISYYNK